MRLYSTIWILIVCLILGASSWSFQNAFAEFKNTTSRMFGEFKNTSSKAFVKLENEVGKGAQTIKTKATELKSTLSRIGSVDNSTNIINATTVYTN
uniref:DUF1664 domain-containing protein n=1 Tax=Rhabditophanes sp. KR3021 TaxID=114890 RepID=A0AC35TW70_9BILA